MKNHFNKELVLTKEDNEDFENSAKSWICDNDYIHTDVKVRDHCHITGKYRGSANRDCNINVKLNQKIPVVFHNLKSYDSHLIKQELDKFNLKINVIPNGLEKYKSFSINNNLSFIDSFQFLSSSLDSLVKNLGKDDFKYLSQEFDNNVLYLVKQKRFYTYEYMSDFEKFNEQLRSKEKFYSSLTCKKISDKEYKHVLNVWNKFEIKTMKCGVLLLPDVLEKFRNNNIKNYGLFPSHYLKLDIISDPDMYIFFVKGMRGGVSYISNRYSKTTNKYLKSYDRRQESKHIIYLDANRLYGYPMSKFLLTSGFKWIDPKEFDLNKYTSISSKGCVLEVCLDYPKELRELHNDYPLTPDKIEIKKRTFVRLPIQDRRYL